MDEKKVYSSLSFNLVFFEKQDVVTVSAGDFDEEKDNDIVGGDIFN